LTPQESNKAKVVPDRSTPKAVMGYRAALGFKGFRYLISAFAVSACGDWLYSTVLVVFVYERTSSAACVAAASIARIAPEIVLGPIAGAVADRYGRKRVMIACDLGRALLMFGLTLVALSRAPVAVALAIVFVATAIGTPSLPATLALTPSLVDEDALAPANSLVSVVDSTALALGPALGGVLFLVGSATPVFALNGASFVLSALLLTRISDKGKAAEVKGEMTSLRDSVVEGLRAVRSSPPVMTLLGLIPPTSFVPGVSFVLFVVVSDELLGTGPEGATFLFAAVGAGGIAEACWQVGQLAAVDPQPLSAEPWP
jgi:MFS family permease